jgi:hypothetical protein
MSKASATGDQPESGQEMPDGVANNIHLRKSVWPRMHVKNRNWVAVIVGETGSGKSLAALRLGEVLDPNFDLNNVHFNVEGVIARAERYEPPGTIDILDEAGIAVGNRTWWEKSNQALNELLQTWREQNRGLILTVPDWDKIDTAIRDRIHHQMTMVSVNHHRNLSTAEFQIVKTDHGGKYDGNDTERVHPAYEIGNRERYFQEIKFRLPTEELKYRYERAKTGTLQALMGDTREELADEADSSNQTGDGRGGRSAQDIADEIIASGIEPYVGDNYGQQYIDRDQIQIDHNIGGPKSRKVKKLILSEVDIDAI